jgi:hypothetical protein
LVAGLLGGLTRVGCLVGSLLVLLLLVLLLVLVLVVLWWLVVGGGVGQLVAGLLGVPVGELGPANRPLLWEPGCQKLLRQPAASPASAKRAQAIAPVVVQCGSRWPGCRVWWRGSKS